jgi:cystathionine beta-lyase
LEEAVSSRTALFLLCNPHNPVGRAYDRSELGRIAELCLRNNLFICSDEIHAGLVLDPDRRHIPIASLSPEVASRTITLFAPSKTFNLPGLGCAFAVISDPVLRGRFLETMEGIVPPVNALGYTAALAAYRYGGEWRRELISYLRENRDCVNRRVNHMPGLAAHHVEATYLAWIDARGTGLANPASFFEQGGVGLSDGSAFGGKGWLRLNFGCPRPILLEALSRMEGAVQRLHAAPGIREEIRK